MTKSGLDRAVVRSKQRAHGRLVLLSLALLAGTAHAALAVDPPPPYVEPGKPGDPTSWDTEEFDANWGLDAIHAQDAYAAGITGKDQKVGIFDSAIVPNSEFDGPGKLTFLETPLGAGPGTGGFTAGYIGANRNGTAAQGVAFDSDVFVASGAALVAVKPDPAAITAAFDMFAKQGIHIIDNSQAGVFAKSLNNLATQYVTGASTLSAIETAVKKNDLLLITPVGANNFSVGFFGFGAVAASTVPGLIASAPYFNPGIAGHAIAVTNLGSTPPDPGIFGIGAVYANEISGVPSLFGSAYSNSCAQTQGWCVAAPGSKVPGLTTFEDDTAHIDAYLTAKKATYNYFDPNYYLYKDYEQYLDVAKHTWIVPITPSPMTGSSMAAAAVAGEAALVQQQFPWMTASQVGDVVLTSATYLPDGSATDRLGGNKAGRLTQITNAGYGWGVINAALAMKGPGQLLRTQTYTVPDGAVATFANPISDSWLKYQQTTLDPAEEKAWQAEIVTKGWQNGLPAKASAADQSEYTYQTARAADRKQRAADPGTLIKAGSGTLTLTGANTYDGGTHIEGGTLEGSATSLQGKIQVDDAATLRFLQDVDGATAAVISGPGTITKAGTGKLTLTGDNSASTGALNLDAGALAIGAANNIGTGPITIGGGGTLEVDGATSLPNTVALLAGNGQFDVEADSTLSGAISGPGALVKTGTATLTLTHANTYSGGTTISAGTIVGNTVTLQGAITGASGSSLVFAQDVDGTFAGAISGAGSIIKNGDGALTLSGDNSADTGSLAINGGRIVIAAARNLGTGPISMSGTTLETDGPAALGNDIAFAANGGTLDVRAASSLSGGLSGAGGLAKLGDASLTLSGVNTFAGPAAINAGTLVLQGGLAIADATPVIIGRTGALEVDNAERVGSVAGGGNGILLNDALFTGGDNSDTTFSGVISGAGSLVKEGGGVFTLSGANSYSGGTVIDGGTLRGDTTSLGGNIIDNALLYFAQDVDGTFAGSISGGGAVDKEGQGTLTLTGDNSANSGTIKIGAGTVVIASATNIGTGAITMMNTTLRIDGPAYLGNDFQLAAGQQVIAVKASTSLTGAMSGDGGFTKSGPGTLTLSGGNTYAGDTIISEGIVNIDGTQSASRAVIASGATLGGSGTVHGIWAKPGSVVSPGHSIGTLYSDDAGIQMDPGSTYHVEVSPFGRADKLVTSGSATINGANLLVTREFAQAAVSLGDLSAVSRSTKLIILDAAGGVSGTFNAHYPDFAFLDLGVSYSKTFVTLTIGRNPVSFADAGLTPNERSVGAAIDGLDGASPVYNALLTAPTLGDAAAIEHQLSGEIHADVAGEVLDDGTFMRDAVLNRMITRVPDASAFWLSGLYSTGITGQDGNASKLNRQRYGVAGGVDQTLGNNWLLGVGGGYEQSPLSTADMGTAKLDSYHVAGYAGGDLLGLSLYFGGTYGRYSASTARLIDVPGLESEETARYGINQGQAFGRIGVPFVIDDATIEPFVTGSYTDASIDKFTESDGPAALENKGQTIDRTQSVVGFRSAITLRDDDAIYTPNLTLGWIHNFDTTTPGVRLGFVGGADSNSFVVNGVTTNTEAGLIHAGIDAALGSVFSLGVGYEGQFGDREQDHAVRVNIRANY